MMWTKSKPENQIETGMATCLFDFEHFREGDMVNYLIYTIMDVKMVKLNGTAVIAYKDFLRNFNY